MFAFNWYPNLQITVNYKKYFSLRFVVPTLVIPSGLSWLNTLSFFHFVFKSITHMELSSVPKEYGGWKVILEVDIADQDGTK